MLRSPVDEAIESFLAFFFFGGIFVGIPLYIVLHFIIKYW